MMKTMKFMILISVALLVSAIPGFTQNDNSTAITKMPGWAVQASAVFEPWDQLVAEAFHFSPDGSFYVLSDRRFELRIATTFLAKKHITGHKIPVDSGCATQYFLDGVGPVDATAPHFYFEMDFEPGEHTLMIVNFCPLPPEIPVPTGFVLGKCLWGTDKDIDFIKAEIPRDEDF